MVFFILFPAQEDNYLDKKITKLVQSYCDEMYDLPSKPEEFESKIRTFQDSYTETEKLLSLTEG
jgi:Txe/YoeB family toxin of Txe-Axe toxin-antitoxin module